MIKRVLYRPETGTVYAHIDNNRGNYSLYHTEYPVVFILMFHEMFIYLEVPQKLSSYEFKVPLWLIYIDGDGLVYGFGFGYQT